MTQIKEILEHLQKHGHITSLEAINLYGATRLSGIIYVLRRRGYTIISEPFEAKTRYGRKTKPTKYILVKGGV